MRRAVFLALAIGIVTDVSAEILDKELELDGKRLVYLEAGERAEPAILLLHGARFSSRTWRELGTIDRLARQGRYVVALDLPGYGRSQTLDADRDGLLVRVLDALHIEKVVVVSPSMSGQFSLPPAWTAI